MLSETTRVRFLTKPERRPDQDRSTRPVALPFAIQKGREAAQAALKITEARKALA